MNCNQVRYASSNQFLDFGDRQLTEEVRLHLMTCASCRRYREDLKHILKSFEVNDLGSVPPKIVKELTLYQNKKSKNDLMQDPRKGIQIGLSVGFALALAVSLFFYFSSNKIQKNEGLEASQNNVPDELVSSSKDKDSNKIVKIEKHAKVQKKLKHQNNQNLFIEDQTQEKDNFSKISEKLKGQKQVEQNTKQVHFDEFSSEEKQNEKNENEIFSNKKKKKNSITDVKPLSKSKNEKISSVKTGTLKDSLKTSMVKGNGNQEALKELNRMHNEKKLSLNEKKTGGLTNQKTNQTKSNFVKNKSQKQKMGKNEGSENEDHNADAIEMEFENSSDEQKKVVTNLKPQLVKPIEKKKSEEINSEESSLENEKVLDEKESLVTDLDTNLKDSSVIQNSKNEKDNLSKEQVKQQTLLFEDKKEGGCEGALEDDAFPSEISEEIMNVETFFAMMNSSPEIIPGMLYTEEELLMILSHPSLQTKLLPPETLSLYLEIYRAEQNQGMVSQMSDQEQKTGASSLSNQKPGAVNLNNGRPQKTAENNAVYVTDAADEDWQKLGDLLKELDSDEKSFSEGISDRQIQEFLSKKSGKSENYHLNYCEDPNLTTRANYSMEF